MDKDPDDIPIVDWLKKRAVSHAEGQRQHAFHHPDVKAHIAALESQLAQYRWRRVEDEMPESWTNVLAWAPDIAISVVVYYDDTDEPGWFNAWSENQMELALTHWMPLPAAPEEETT